ncbi:MAG TPA: methylmalonyl-CoA mutase family protein, partial [Terricaulis sp.]|nr:methylmalonyl-CoA mutase family protein [Terricaulis sp.]
AIRTAGDLDAALADVLLEAAPVSLDAEGISSALLLETKLKGVAASGTAFNLDPIWRKADWADTLRFAQRVRAELPNASALRADARPVHEAGATDAQEIAAALSIGISYLRALSDAGLPAGAAAPAIAFAISVGPDVLIEAAKLRALRLCWARVMEASGTEPQAREARIHAFTSQRMLTRYDSNTNILRITTAAFAAAIGGANAITTGAFTDALGLPTPFARRVARNTQAVLMEECRLGHVADPAGGAWFVEKLTRELAAKAWEIMQLIESKGGIVATLESGLLPDLVAGARTARQKLIATRRETITGVTDFPLLDAKEPEVWPMDRRRPRRPAPAFAGEGAGGPYLTPIRWADPFEALLPRLGE